jgi:hypothetical protein
VYKPAELWQAKEHHPPPKKRSCTMVFTLKEMEEATNMFSDRNLVGKGGFGRVYRGVLKDGQVLACLLFTNPSLHPSFFFLSARAYSQTHANVLVWLSSGVDVNVSFRTVLAFMRSIFQIMELCPMIQVWKRSSFLLLHVFVGISLSFVSDI